MWHAPDLYIVVGGAFLVIPPPKKNAYRDSKRRNRFAGPVAFRERETPLCVEGSGDVFRVIGTAVFAMIVFFFLKANC